jgi:hypothetical protein
MYRAQYKCYKVSQNRLKAQFKRIKIKYKVCAFCATQTITLLALDSGATYCEIFITAYYMVGS